MTTRKRNEFLEGSESEDEGLSQGYNSEAEDVQKGARSVKRRKVDSDEESDGIDGDEDDLGGDSDDNDTQQKKSTSVNSDRLGGAEVDTRFTNTFSNEESEHPTEDANEGDTNSSPSKLQPVDLPGVSKPLSKTNLVATGEAIKRSGVVYLSRIPPFMKPHKLRSLLEPYGTINRIFLTPEDPTSHTKRVRNGGNKKRSFVDGWVEFVNKNDAKEVCELLNARTIGGKKGSYYRDDVWNLLYLKGFKWGNLTEQIAAENAERASRMRAEISRTTKENKEFVANVERSKMLEGMKAKEEAKKAREGDEDGGAPVREKKPRKERAERPMNFKQTAVAPKKGTGNQSEQVKNVLGMIF